MDKKYDKLVPNNKITDINDNTEFNVMTDVVIGRSSSKNQETFIGYLAYKDNKKRLRNSKYEYWVNLKTYSKNRHYVLNLFWKSELKYSNRIISYKALEIFLLWLDNYETILNLDNLQKLIFQYCTTTNAKKIHKNFIIDILKLNKIKWYEIKHQVKYKSNKYVIRKGLVKIEIDNISNVEYISPGKLVLTYTKSKLVKEYYDFGQFCYIKRLEKIPLIGDNSEGYVPAHLVEESSFSKIREKVIIGLLDLYRLKALRPGSYNSLYQELKSIFNYIDKDYDEDLLNSIESIESIYFSYTQYLELLVTTGKIKPSSAQKRQSIFIDIIYTLYPKEYKHISSKYTLFSEGINDSSEADSKKEVKRFFNHLLEYTLKLHLQLHNKNFPICINISHYSTYYPLTGYKRIIRCDSSDFHRPIGTVYDHINKGIKNQDTLLNQTNSLREIANLNNDFNLYRRELHLVLNDNLKSKHLQYIVNQLVTYYAYIFIGITGANTTDIIQWDYTQSIEVSKDVVNKEFIEVKFRAGGRETKYPIGGNKGLKILKNYLTLRKYLAKLSKHDKLFVFVTKDAKLTNISDFQDKFPRKEHRSSSQFETIFPDNVNYVTPRKLRLNKSVVLHELNISSRYIADLLNHTVNTNQNNYTKPNIDDRVQSCKQYWQAVKSGIKQKSSVNKTNTNDEEIVSGHCKDKGSPIPINVESPFKVNCIEEYGCLFCDNFVCHLDKDDIHKILSLRYVVKTIKNFASDYHYAEDVFRFILIRIEEILIDIRIHENFNHILNEYINKVDNLGILTPFWERKLSRYEKMGLYI